MEHTCSDASGSLGCEKCWQDLNDDHDAVILQNKIMRKALQSIITTHGPGIDGSPEELAGKIARETLEKCPVEPKSAHDAALLQIRDLKDILESVQQEYKDDMACDCGTDEKGSCAYCRLTFAVAEKQIPVMLQCVECLTRSGDVHPYCHDCFMT